MKMATERRGRASKDESEVASAAVTRRTRAQNTGSSMTRMG